MKIYERNINSSVTKIADQIIVVESSLLDLNHAINVVLKINLVNATIEDAKAEITKAPLHLCQKTTSHIKNIVGLKIERGVNRQLAHFLGGSSGCTHLYELALNAVRLAFNVKVGLNFDWQQWISRSIDEDDFIERAKPHLSNSCLPFKSDKTVKEVVPRKKKK